MYLLKISKNKSVVTPYTIAVMTIAEGIKKKKDSFDIANFLFENLYGYIGMNNLKIEENKSNDSEMLFIFKGKE